MKLRKTISSETTEHLGGMAKPLNTFLEENLPMNISSKFSFY
jgi:hypothetical protein